MIPSSLSTLHAGLPNGTAAARLPPYAADVARGLGTHPMSLPSYLFYDERGSQLFEAIMRTREYYLTRAEVSVFRRRGDDLARAIGPVQSVIELGAGNGLKTGVLLEHMLRYGGGAPIDYVPIDVSRVALESACENLARPGVTVHPLMGRYEDAIDQVRLLPGPRLLMFIGSSLGNYDPQAASQLLQTIRAALEPADHLLLGVDLRKDPALMVPAYDDEGGVTATFNKNALVRLNRELGANFDPDLFRHLARWNERASRMEMWLLATHDQHVTIPALHMELAITAGDAIHTENSYKPSLPDLLRMVRTERFVPDNIWLAPRYPYALILAEPAV